MTSITKDALIERGFIKHVKHDIYTKRKGDINIIVNGDNNHVCVERDYGSATQARGCTTLEQLDQLILMFLK